MDGVAADLGPASDCWISVSMDFALSLSGAFCTACVFWHQYFGLSKRSSSEIFKSKYYIFDNAKDLAFK